MIPDWGAERERMVAIQLEKRGIRDRAVLRAMATIPRQEFIPPEARIHAYRDEPAPIGFGQTISQPYMTALMAECLELRGHETVLEVGAGSGYAAAVLGALARRVIAIEIIPELAAVAEANLRRTGCGANVEIACYDGSRGWPACAPYDAISVAAGAPDIPVALLEQLADPGVLVIPVGEEWDQELRVIRKIRRRIEFRVATLCRFVLLRGEQGWR